MFGLKYDLRSVCLFGMVLVAYQNLITQVLGGCHHYYMTVTKNHREDVTSLVAADQRLQIKTLNF